MSYVHDRKEAEVTVNIVDFVFAGRKYIANIFTGDSIEAIESAEGKTLRECLLDLRKKLDKLNIEYRDAYIYAEWIDEELTEDDELAWETRLQDLK